MKKHARFSLSVHARNHVPQVLVAIFATALCIMIGVFLISGAMGQKEAAQGDPATGQSTGTIDNGNTDTLTSIDISVITSAILDITSTATNTPTPTPTPTIVISITPTATPTTRIGEQTSPDGVAPDLTGYVVVLDPGHQTHANYDTEPLGPDMEGSKAKCSSGTQGVSTGRPEYEVNLEIGLKMKDYLESLGCVVYMTRTTNQVDISNIERADFALSHDPDVYIRLHCNGSSDSSVRGISVHVADTGKYKSDLETWGDFLGECMSDLTDTKFRGTYPSSIYSGLNWATDIPSFLLEMGFMSNATDDELLSDPDFQQLICEAVAEFVSEMPQR
jgi:N-acetylmuramoyl-L-alanine amidase